MRVAPFFVLTNNFSKSILFPQIQFSMEYTNHPSLCVWVPLLNKLMMESTSVNCAETLKQSQSIMETKATMRKDLEPLVVTLENKLDHYFNEQNGKLVKVTNPLDDVCSKNY